MSGVPEPDAAWPSKQSDSVEPATTEKPTAEETDPETRAFERVREFVDQYSDLASLPVCKTDGRKLRREVTDSTWTEEVVEAHDDVDGGETYTSHELRQRRATDWSDALTSFLLAHIEYEGLTARFQNGLGETFDVELEDSWGQSYNESQYARAKALQREMSGGERPTGGSPDGQWSDPTTAMLTLTASSVPDVRLSPVDHLDAIHDSWTDNCRDTLRNVCEYHLGLESSEWGYWLQTEPHGAGGDGGMNACYSHIHIALYFDGAATSATNQQVGSELERVIDKHLEVCEPAGPSAHDYQSIQDYTDSDGCISVNGSVENLGSYLASYLGSSYEQPLLERPVEYLAWASIYWASARQRTTRSQLVNHAITADACDQRFESDHSDQPVPHGEKLVEDSASHGADIVCKCCGSGWRVDEEIPDHKSESGLVLEDDQDDDQDGDDLEDDQYHPDNSDIRSRWPTADECARAGETLSHRQARQKIAQYIEQNDSFTFAQLCGALHLDPRWHDLARAMIQGSDGKPEPDSFRRLSDSSEWELKEIIDRDGDLHEPGGGGIDMVPLNLPQNRLVTALEDTHQKSECSRYRCECGVAAYGQSMASHLLGSHNIRDPDVAVQSVSLETA
jgi:hypothetical protein